jgi:hypothetical protein
MRPVFADPKTTVIFKRIFGRETHKPLLIELLNDLLELSGDHRIVDLQYLSPEQCVAVEELKLTLIDVKCFDQHGRHYMAKLQVLIIEGFEKRLVVLAGFSAGELDIYERVKMSEQDARGALSLARRQSFEEGFREGFEEGLRETREERRRQGLDGGPEVE